MNSESRTPVTNHEERKGKASPLSPLSALSASTAKVSPYLNNTISKNLQNASPEFRSTHDSRQNPAFTA